MKALQFIGDDRCAVNELDVPRIGRRRGASRQPQRRHLPLRHRAARRPLHHPVRVPGDPRPRVGRRGRAGRAARSRASGVGDRVVGECVIGQRPLRLQHQRCRGRVLRRQGVLAAPPAGQPLVDAGRARRAVQLRLLRDGARRQPRRERHGARPRRRADRAWGGRGRCGQGRAGASSPSRRPPAESSRAPSAPTTYSTRPIRRLPRRRSSDAHRRRGRVAWSSRPAASPPAMATALEVAAFRARLVYIGIDVGGSRTGRGSACSSPRSSRLSGHHRLAGRVAADPAVPLPQRRRPQPARDVDRTPLAEADEAIEAVLEDKTQVKVHITSDATL